MSSNETTKFQFKAEIRQLLDILAHSLYSSREIFLRELISNSSDALDKLRFISNSGTEILDKELPYEIKIEANKEKNTLSISDTGIGMTREELIKNIGTIAKSSSAEFIQQLKSNNADASNIIGRFGVGFYSVFMVAKEVTIESKSYIPSEPGVVWKSDGLGEFEIVENQSINRRGTKIIIHLKDDAKEFTEKYRLENVIKTHSNFISFPIYLENEKINTVAAIWREPKSNLTKEQYQEFYKYLTYDPDPPKHIIHVNIDAPIQFNALLFIPEKNNDIFGLQRENYGLDLYVRRVLIQHKNKDLLPEYLSFVKGVVDSEDLPLNISRETLQENAIFNKIAQSVTSQVLSYLIKTAKESPEDYNSFWKEHGKYFKLGYGDYANQEKFLQLLRFNSSINSDENGLTSLEEYVAKFREGQKEIYYISKPSRAAIEVDPLIEIFQKKGIEILYLFDPVDEFVVASLRKYKDYEFKPVDQADLKEVEKIKDLSSENKSVPELSRDDKKHLDSLLSKMKDILGDRVKEIRLSKRLFTSPVCLVNPDDAYSATMQRIMRLSNKELTVSKKILEVNPDSPLVRNLLSLFKKDSHDDFLKNMIEQLFEVSQLIDGELADPHKLTNKLLNYFELSSNWYLDMKNR